MDNIKQNLLSIFRYPLNLQFFTNSPKLNSPYIRLTTRTQFLF